MRAAVIAIGVVACIVYIERGQRRITVNYAKRQQTWFGKDRNIQWIDLDAHDTTADAAMRIMQVLAPTASR